VLSLVISIGAAGAPTVAAQEPSSAAIVLLRRTPWVDVGGTFEVLVHAPGAATVEASVHDELVGSGGRSRFRTQLAGGDLGPQIGSTRPLVDEGSGRWRLEIPIQPAPAASDGEPLDLPSAGVYPLEIRGFDGDGNGMGSLLTHIVLSPAEGAFPALASVLAVAGPTTTATRPDGSVRLDDAALANTIAVASAANRVPDVPFLYNLTPETIDALDEVDRDRLSRSSVAVPDGPWARLDLGAWLSQPDLSDQLDHQIERGRAAIDAAGIDRATAAIQQGPVTALKRDVLTFAGADLLIASSDLAVGLEPPTVGRLHPARLDGSELRALVVDERLQDHLSGAEGDPLLGVHHMLADLAVLFFDRPNDQRSVLLWIEDPAALGAEVLAVLLDAADGSGRILGATDAADALSSSDVEGTFSMARRPPPSLDGYAEGLAAAVDDIRVWDSVLATTDDRATELEATLDATAAMDVVDDADEWFARARAIVDAQLTGITIPDRQTVTLTEREAELPIRINNDLGYEANVLVKLDSTRLEVPQQGRNGIAVRLATGANDLRIPVRARAAGSFPLDVTVSTPRGARVLAEGRFSVRTTVLNGVGIALTAGSLLVLLVWWARHFRDGRRDRRLVEREEPVRRHESTGVDH
jgi:hypothetical protein